jgi:hypothetical protein
VDDIITITRRQRHTSDFGHPEFTGEVTVNLDEGIEAILPKADKIHFVDSQNNVLNAKQVDNGAVPSGLDGDPLHRIHEQNSQVADAGRRDHVARVLLVSRCIGENKSTPRTREVTVGNVDSDPLLALSLKTIEEKSEIQTVAYSTELLALGFESRELVVRHFSRIVEQPADERALTIIYASAGEKSQQVRLLCFTVGYGSFLH